MIYAVNKRTLEHVAEPSMAQIGLAKDWRLVEATPDGWIKCNDDECPLPASARCDVRFGGGIVNDAKASQPVWGMVEAYRPIPDADTKPEPPAWDGEGLPPLGTVCEAYIHHGNWRWADAEILKHGDGECAVYATKLRCLAWGTDFRPIRSEEDRAVDHMKSVAGTSYVKPEVMEMICRALYRAGYRKEES